MFVRGRAASSPGTPGMAACVPTLMNTRSPASTRVPPSFSWISSVLGATNRPEPMISSAPLDSKLRRCAAMLWSTMARLRSRTIAMSIATRPVLTPYSAPWRTSDATFALWISFLLGMQLILGQEPPIHRRSTTAVRRPARAMCHAKSLPPAPLPRTRISSRSDWDMPSSRDVAALRDLRTTHDGRRLQDEGRIHHDDRWHPHGVGNASLRLRRPDRHLDPGAAGEGDQLENATSCC